MLTLFSTPKPFHGHIGIIQRNAIQSWKHVHPDVEVILFGDEDGAAEICREFGLRHVPFVPKNDFGTKLLRGIFEPAQRMARHDILCYLNCDIVLVPSFAAALTRTVSSFPQFLMVGQRCDVDITEPWDFAAAGWDRKLEAFAAEHGSLHDRTGIDYFAFSRGMFTDMPPLVIGRIWWDHWLVWHARSLHAAVIDATRATTALHQNHDYGYHPAGAGGVWRDEQSQKNFELAGGKWHLYTIDDATHRLAPDKIGRSLSYPFAPLRRASRPYVAPLWFKFLDFTRPVRRLVGLRRRALP
jgi:hypothetical protein